MCFFLFYSIWVVAVEIIKCLHIFEYLIPESIYWDNWNTKNSPISIQTYCGQFQRKNSLIAFSYSAFYDSVKPIMVHQHRPKRILRFFFSCIKQSVFVLHLFKITMTVVFLFLFKFPFNHLNGGIDPWTLKVFINLSSFQANIIKTIFIEILIRQFARFKNLSGIWIGLYFLNETSNQKVDRWNEN